MDIFCEIWLYPSSCLDANNISLLFINILSAPSCGFIHIHHIQSDTYACHLFICCLHDFSAITDFIFCYPWYIFKPFILYPAQLVGTIFMINNLPLCFSYPLCKCLVLLSPWQHRSILSNVWNWVAKQCSCDTCESWSFQ
jgi:hypothetical protein